MRSRILSVLSAPIFLLGVSCAGSAETTQPADDSSGVVVPLTLLSRSDDPGYRPVDAATLEPLPPYVPLDSGHWSHHHVSPSGRILASVVGETDLPKGRLRLFDLVNWNEIETFDDPIASLYPLAWAPDDSAVYFVEDDVVDDDAVKNTLWVADLGSQTVRWVTTLRYYVDRIDFSADGDTLYAFAFNLASEYRFEADGDPFLVALDARSGEETARVPLPGVLVGQRRDSGLEDFYVTYRPGLAISPDAKRYYVAHPDSARITEVDLTTMTVHRSLEPELDRSFAERVLEVFAGSAAAAPTLTHTRQITVSADGGYLYITGRTRGPISGGEGHSPSGLSVVRTSDLSLVLEEGDVDSIALSPDGDYVYATGWSYEYEQTGEHEAAPANVQGYGMRILDTQSMEFVAHVDSGAVYHRAHVSGDGRYVYLMTDRGWDDPPECELPCEAIAVYDVALGEIVERLHFEDVFVDLVTAAY